MGTSHKNRGGLANKRGNLFEDHFVVWRLVHALERTRQGEPVELAEQLLNAHVDDVVERRGKKRHHYQLKAGKVVRWRDVTKDFKRQLKKGSSAVTLVVATEAQRDWLASLDKRVKGAGVLAFPRADHPQEVLSDSTVRADFLSGCVKDSPTDADLDMMWNVIAGAWSRARKFQKFVSIQTVLKHFPDQVWLVRVRWTPTPKWRAAEKLLSAVAGFSFVVKDGHLRWKDTGGFEGLLSCRTATFKTFVDAVLHVKPTTLDQLRGLL